MDRSELIGSRNALDVSKKEDVGYLESVVVGIERQWKISKRTR